MPLAWLYSPIRLNMPPHSIPIGVGQPSTSRFFLSLPARRTVQGSNSSVNFWSSGGKDLGKMLLNHHRNLSQMMVEKGTGTSPGYQKKTGWCWYPQHLQHMEPETCGCPFTVDDCFSHWIRHNCWVPS